MFERYTEKARRVVFFARFEASNFGGDYIEPEHLLLGILREGPLREWIGEPEKSDAMRQAIESRMPRGEKKPTSVDMPLSHPAKRVLAYAGEEAERLSHQQISETHIVLGLLREESLAARVLREYKFDLPSVRERAKSLPPSTGLTGLGPPLQFRPDLNPPGPIELVIGLAAEEAQRLGQHLQPQHLLLGILRHANSPGARILTERGITLESLRAELSSGQP